MEKNITISQEILELKGILKKSGKSTKSKLQSLVKCRIHGAKYTSNKINNSK